MNTSIVKHQPLTPAVWQMIQEIAPFARDSRLFGVATPQQAMMIMAKGHELGLPLTTSFEYIHVISDKPTLSPRGALALIIQSGECEELKIEETRDAKGNPDACKVYMKRKNGISYTASFSMADAARADLVKAGSGWAKYPFSMLKWRAVGFAADIVFPDIIGGLKRADELGADLTADGEVIPNSWKVQKPQQPTKTPRVPIQDLLDKYSPDTIIAAAGGNLPQSQAEVDAVAAKLEAELGAVTIDAVAEVAP